MVILDETIVTIALPDIQNTLVTISPPVSWVQNITADVRRVPDCSRRAGDISAGPRARRLQSWLFTVASADRRAGTSVGVVGWPGLCRE